ncbi:hypothetical protein MRB53_006371 [Persea americana]|uniref:Uncharacterized protein n=1 Tax=Persea americana TaxID=3435 RepID=A0ACC2MGW6_PERAE|nr:hypothetical protein MRB53_006371 [Persea americana]
MIIKIKARHMKNKLRTRFQPNQVTTYGARSVEYSLTVEEAALLDIFWNEYEAKHHLLMEQFVDHSGQEHVISVPQVQEEETTNPQVQLHEMHKVRG